MGRNAVISVFDWGVLVAQLTISFKTRWTGDNMNTPRMHRWGQIRLTADMWPARTPIRAFREPVVDDCPVAIPRPRYHLGPGVQADAGLLESKNSTSVVNLSVLVSACVPLDSKP